MSILQNSSQPQATQSVIETLNILKGKNLTPWVVCSTPNALSPDALSPHALSPCALSPCTLRPDGLSENVLSGEMFRSKSGLLDE